MPETPQTMNVLIVDDSRIFRGVIEEVLADCPGVRVVGSVWSGEKALEFARASLPDFVTLDIAMPGIGGIKALKGLRELAVTQHRPLGVLLVSSHTRRNAAVTIEGLQEGAFDFVTKPDGPDAQANTSLLRDELIAKIKAYRGRRAVITSAPSPVLQRNRIDVRKVSSGDAKAERRLTRFRAIVIGASTGGPPALNQVLPALAAGCPVPVFIVQHFPIGFTHFFAADLERRSGLRVVEAQEGVAVQAGTVYVAPGGKHLVLNEIDGKVVMRFGDSPPENGCRPAADVLFRSASAAYSGQVLALILTGMGSDGAKGAAELKRAGAHVIAQDEATSVVWGMPGRVVEAGAAHEVLPLDEIGPALRTHLGMDG